MLHTLVITSTMFQKHLNFPLLESNSDQYMCLSIQTKIVVARAFQILASDQERQDNQEN
jgi:hypothetical protein